MNTRFHPDTARAQGLNARMNTELGASLQHVCEQADGHIEFDRAALDRLVRHLLDGRNVPPATFAHYFELVKAIYAGDAGETKGRFETLARTTLTEPPLEIVALGDPALGAESDLYIEKWNENHSEPLGFTAPSRKIAEEFRVRLSQGLELVRAALPELHGEIEAIIHQIVIVGRNPDCKYQVDGGSHFQLWGALFLNGHFHPDRIAVAEVLAHESAHSLLFGFCTDEPLTHNDEEARYASPLREDLRPMDGIYHATYVSARMHWAMSQLAGSDLLSDAERARALKCAEDDRRNFLAGHGVVVEHGDLTETGARLMAHARDYIEDAPALTQP